MVQQNEKEILSYVWRVNDYYDNQISLLVLI